MIKKLTLIFFFGALVYFFLLKEHPELLINTTGNVPEKNQAVMKDRQIADTRSKSIENADEWKLVFLDNFNQSKMDSSKWQVLSKEENYNNELQEYKHKNVKMQNGRLYLLGMKEGGRYSSGLVQTKGKFDFLYGKIEIKASYPSGKGLFPAIWLLRADGKDHLPEIDIFEAVGHEPEIAYMVQHWRNKGKLKTVYGTREITNYQEDHIFGLEWEREEIRWYIDKELVFKSKNYNTDLPMYLIINLAIGGNWPGSPNSKTLFPAEFSVDYVKIYEREKSHE